MAVIDEQSQTERPAGSCCGFAPAGQYVPAGRRPGSAGRRGWCALNYWRCRRPHCAVTGTSWLALGAFFLVEAAVGHSIIGGDEQPLMLAFLVAGLGYEAAWFLRHRGG